MRRCAFLILGVVLLGSGLGLGPESARAQEGERLEVVTSLPTYAAIAREITGEHARVRAIARGDEDPHFVNPRPSFAAMIQGADLFVTTGLDLELWVPGLLDRAGNARVMEDADGHVAAYSGIELLQVPESASRSEGDVHVFGNPHVHTDPVNGIIIARNIRDGLKRVAPGRSDLWERNTAAFEEEVLRRTFGEQLVEMLGSETLIDLARSHRFWSFAREQSYQGRPLTDYLGGWLERAAAFRGERMVCYHKNWAYFSQRFQVECAEYIERRPGIPPSPGHVRKVISFIQDEGIRVLLAVNYYSAEQVRRIADRTGAVAVRVPEHVDGGPGAGDYFELVDLWVEELARAFGDR
jgi:ABC-type Zn uptake system ZnuABC Zn-binding protein ZnuA